MKEIAFPLALILSLFQRFHVEGACKDERIMANLLDDPLQHKPTGG